MTFTTLQYDGVELQLADWGVTRCQLTETSQVADKLTVEITMPADGASPFPYGAKVILSIGRIAQSFPNGGVNPQTGAPDCTGETEWGDGYVKFIGYLNNSPDRSGAAADEKLIFTFDCPWKTFFEDLIYRKLWWSWNGTAQYADWRGQIVLGLSPNALVGAGDTVPGSSATNLMSIQQEVRAILNYADAQATTEYGAHQFQWDSATIADGGGNYSLYITPGTNKLVIPDFIAGTFLTEDTQGGIPVSATPWEWTPGIYADAINGVSATPSNGTSVSGLDIANLQLITDLTLRAPLNSVNNTSCAEALRYEIKWLGPMGDIAVWFDYTTTLDDEPCPTLHIVTRDQMDSITLPFPTLPNSPLPTTPSALIGPNGPMLVQATKARRLDNLIPSAVDIEFRITGSSAGKPYVTVYHDIAAWLYGSGSTYGTKPGTGGDNVGAFYEGIGLPGVLLNLDAYFSNDQTYVGGSANNAIMQALQAAGRSRLAVNLTLDMEGNSNAVSYCTIKTAGIDTSSPTTGSGSAYNFWKAVLPEITNLLDLAGTSSTGPDLVGSVTAKDDLGNTLTVGSTSITDTNGNVYDYILTDGQIAPWMLAGNAAGGAGAVALQCTLSAVFNGTETNDSVQTGTVVHHPKTARVTLVSVPGNTYQKWTPTQIAEQIPYGLAGYVFRYASIPHYEGTYTIQEVEITDQCPMGNNLNFSRGLPEWLTMNASMQSISYDFFPVRTTLTYGPAKHLSPAELSSRLKVNHGPRWFNLNGSNVTNDPNAQPGTTLGSSVAQRGPSPGSPARNWHHLPLDLDDESSNSYPYGSPGIHLDNRTDPPPNYGNISGLSAPNGQPTIFLSEGSDGTLGAMVRISTADLGGTNVQAYFQPMTVLSCADGVMTNKTIWVLCTDPE